MYQYLSAFLLGFISKYLDDRELDIIAKILILISVILWTIYLIHFLVMGLAIILAVYFAGKIDTKTLNLYFLAAVLGLILSLIYGENSSFRLAPFLIYLIALYYDEKEIKLFGYERILIYVALLGMMILSLLIYAIEGIKLEKYIEDFYAIILFDIGYVIAARLVNR